MNSFVQLHSATHGRCSIDRKHAFGDLKSLWDLQVVTVIALSCVLRRFGSLQQVVAGSNLKMPKTSGIGHQKMTQINIPTSIGAWQTRSTKRRWIEELLGKIRE